MEIDQLFLLQLLNGTNNDNDDDNNNNNNNSNNNNNNKNTLLKVQYPRSSVDYTHEQTLPLQQQSQSLINERYIFL